MAQPKDKKSRSGCKKAWSMHNATGAKISLDDGKFETVVTKQNTKSTTFGEIHYISQPIPDKDVAETLGLWKHKSFKTELSEDSATYRPWSENDDDETTELNDLNKSGNGLYEDYAESEISNEDNNVWKLRDDSDTSTITIPYFEEKETVLDGNLSLVEHCTHPVPRYVEDMKGDEWYSELNEEEMIGDLELFKLKCESFQDHSSKESDSGVPTIPSTDKLAKQTLFEPEHPSPELPVRKTRCKDYEDMVKIFRPLITQNVLVREILPHLPFIDDCSSIRNVDINSSSNEAMEKLLDKLMKSKELGKWKQFVNALRSAGYNYIVENIKGYRMIDSQYQKEYLKILTPKLIEMIDPKELLPYLISKNIIGENDKQEIEQEQTNRGRIAASSILLDRITRKHSFWYPNFVECLKEANMPDIAVDLDIPEMIDDKRESTDAATRPKNRAQNQYSNKGEWQPCKLKKLSQNSYNKMSFQSDNLKQSQCASLDNTAKTISQLDDTISELHFDPVENTDSEFASNELRDNDDNNHSYANLKDITLSKQNKYLQSESTFYCNTGGEYCDAKSQTDTNTTDVNQLQTKSAKIAIHSSVNTERDGFWCERDMDETNCETVSIEDFEDGNRANSTNRQTESDTEYVLVDEPLNSNIDEQLTADQSSSHALEPNSPMLNAIEGQSCENRVCTKRQSYENAKKNHTNEDRATLIFKPRVPIPLPRKPPYQFGQHDDPPEIGIKEKEFDISEETVTSQLITKNEGQDFALVTESYDDVNDKISHHHHSIPRNPSIKNLQEKMNRLRIEKEELRLENSLLDDAHSMQEEVNIELKRKREMSRRLDTKEKEAEALKEAIEKGDYIPSKSTEDCYPDLSSAFNFRQPVSKTTYDFRPQNREAIPPITDSVYGQSYDGYLVKLYDVSSRGHVSKKRNSSNDSAFYSQYIYTS